MYFASHTECASNVKYKAKVNEELFRRKRIPSYHLPDQHLQFHMHLVHPYPWEILVNQRQNSHLKFLIHGGTPGICMESNMICLSYPVGCDILGVRYFCRLVTLFFDEKVLLWSTSKML